MGVKAIMDGIAKMLRVERRARSLGAGAGDMSMSPLAAEPLKSLAHMRRANRDLPRLEDRLPSLGHNSDRAPVDIDGLHLERVEHFHDDTLAPTFAVARPLEADASAAGLDGPTKAQERSDVTQGRSPFRRDPIPRRARRAAGTTPRRRAR